MRSQQPDLEMKIFIEDPCLRPASISAPFLNDQVEEYFYTTSGATFNVNSLVIDPPVCFATFECLSITGTDLVLACDDPRTVSLNTETGRLNF